MSTITKLNYLADTKDELKDKLNEHGANITDNDTFRSYVDKIKGIYNNWPKVTGEGTEITLTPTRKGRMQLDLKGNTSQDSTTGKNLFDNSVERKNAYPGGEIGGQIVYINSNATYSYVKCAYLEAGKTYTISWQQNIAPASENDRVSRIIDENNINLALFNSWRSNSNSISYTPSVSGYLVLSTDINSTNIMIEEGSTATDYEPYTNGASPNPDYPQPIHVVTGENVIKQYSKNLLYFPYSTYNWSGTSYINGSKIVIEGSAAISSSVRVASKYNINIPRNTTVTFSVRILKGKEFYKKSWAQFGYNLYYDDGSEEKHDVSFYNTNYIDSIRFFTTTTLKKVVAIAPFWGASAIGERGNFITFGIQMEIGSNVTEYMDGKAVENYPINLGNIEPCKIGDYQDKFVKDNGVWKIPNKIVKIDSYNGESITTPYISTTGGLDIGATIYYIGNEDYTITDETLIAQLDAIENAMSTIGTTTITQTNSDLPFIISASALKKGGN